MSDPRPIGTITDLVFNIILPKVLEEIIWSYILKDEAPDKSLRLCLYMDPTDNLIHLRDIRCITTSYELTFGYQLSKTSDKLNCTSIRRALPPGLPSSNNFTDLVFVPKQLSFLDINTKTLYLRERSKLQIFSPGDPNTCNLPFNSKDINVKDKENIFEMLRICEYNPCLHCSICSISDTFNNSYFTKDYKVLCLICASTYL